jgi:hypothetical protein
MSNVITQTREAIQTYLATPFPPPVAIDGGRADGVNRDPFPKIRIWHPSYAPQASSRTLAKPTLTLRYFPPLSKQPSATTPRDQEALEQAEVDLLTAFADKNRAGDFVANVAVSVTTCVLNDDADRWYVEMTLTALMQNIAQQAA